VKQKAKLAHQLKWIDGLIALLIFSAFLAQSVHTIHQVGPCWDEPVYFHLVKRYVEWFRNLSIESFSETTLDSVFKIKLHGNAHPSLAKLLATASYVLFKNFLGEFWAFRFYAPILFALLLSLIYVQTTQTWGRLAGIASVLCTGLMPRLFTDGHIGATEAPLMFFWFLTTLMFSASFQNRRLAPVAGVCYGLAMSVKFTGFLLPIPVLFSALFYHRRKLLFPALCLALLGPVVFLILQPSMWHHPVRNFLEFLQISLFREGKTSIDVFFLGHHYEFSAPWYYAPFMVMVTVPVLTLALFLLGIFRAVLNLFKDELSVSSLIHFSFFMLITMLPNAPTYDGVRLFDPAFIFLGLLAGYGFAGLFSWLKKTRLKLLAQSGLILLLILGTVLPFVKVYPYGLEYYNELIRGPSGAKRLGLETTYWFTVINENDVKHINSLLPQNARLMVYPRLAHMGEFYQELGLLRNDIKMTQRQDFEYLLMLSRPWWDLDENFLAIRTHPSRLEILDQKTLDGVPLWVFYRKKDQEQ